MHICYSKLCNNQALQCTLYRYKILRRSLGLALIKICNLYSIIVYQSIIPLKALNHATAYTLLEINTSNNHQLQIGAQLDLEIQVAKFHQTRLCELD